MTRSSLLHTKAAAVLGPGGKQMCRQATVRWDTAAALQSACIEWWIFLQCVIINLATLQLGIRSTLSQGKIDWRGAQILILTQSLEFLLSFTLTAQTLSPARCMQHRIEGFSAM